jgi:opine dehydrogenase
MKVAVLGAGHGGVAMSADLTLAGHEVNLYQVPEFEESFKKIKETRTIEIVGAAREGKAKLKMATTDISEAMEGVDYVIIVVPAFAHESMAELCARYLRPGQIIFVVPGGFGSFILYKKLLEHNRGNGFAVAETSTLPYGARTAGDNKVIVHIRTINLPMGVLPTSRTLEVVEIFRKLFPETAPCKNILDAALSNTNPIIHVAPTILNTGRIEYADDFYLYLEGMSKSVRKVQVAADRERVAVRKAFGLDEPHYQLDPDTNDVFKDQFGPGALEAGQKMRGPLAMNERYITEDVPYGMVFYSSLGKLAGVDTPVCDSLIKLSSIINSADYVKEGRTTENLGIKDWSSRQLLDFIEKGGD